MFRCPSLQHLNLMKNPCNPVFSSELQYSQFRARFAIWIPDLKTLDGTDFKDDSGFVMKMKHAEQAKMAKARGETLHVIPEESGATGPRAHPTSYTTPLKGENGEVIDKNIKAQAGNTAF